MGKFILKRKLYSKYDDTDNLKRMTDADILAEKEKKDPGYRDVIAEVGTGALAGAVAGGLYGGLKKGGSFKKGLKHGAILGGSLMAIGALRKRKKEKDDVEFYNRRLSYAQSQARRREGKDWVTNMTKREGYSF